MDIEQAMRAMAPLPEIELALAFGLETEAPWPPRLTAADRRAARRVRTELLAPEPWEGVHHQDTKDTKRK